MSSVNDPSGTARWRVTLLPATATIQEAIRCLDGSGLQIVMVVTADGSLYGTVTDGDVRRGLLRGLDLTSPVEMIVYRQPLVVTSEVPRELVLQLMRANRVRQLPVVDSENRVIGLHTWDAIISPDHRESLIVIMAGGMGTRLRPHTDKCPKPLLSVGGKPILQHIIERAIASGFARFVIAVHYLGHMIEEYFGDGTRWGVRIEYVHESEPLGTAGALGLLTPRPQGSFVVTNGDVLTDVRYHDLLEFHGRHGASATMAVRVHEWQNPFGVVRTEGVDIIELDEKPVSRSHVNAGIYAFEPGVIDLLERGVPCDIPTLFLRLRERNSRTIVYPMHEPWLDVGRDVDLETARLSVGNDGR